MALLNIVKKLPGSTAAELYRVPADQPRFRQKDHLALQTEWNSEYIELGAKWLSNRKRYVSEGKPGFSLLDRALMAGSAALLGQSGFSMHYSNLNGTSWETLTLGSHEGKRWEEEQANATMIVAAAARYFGAADVGIAQLDRRWVYSHYYHAETKSERPIKFNDEPGYERYAKPGFAENGAAVIPAGMKYVLVLIHEMEHEAMKAGPNLLEFAATRLAYSEIAFTAISLAEFIRALGYSAIPSANCVALNIPLAVDAGLGEMGRSGKLITRRFGPRCRISKVITDLPLFVGAPVDLGIRRFCSSCLNCYYGCPVKAISGGSREISRSGDFTVGGVYRWEIDELKCRQFWTKAGTNCGLCITSCPFNKPRHIGYDAARLLVSRAPLFNRLLLALNNKLQLNRPTSSAIFWQKKIKQIKKEFSE